jgi:hypothetical protein
VALIKNKVVASGSEAISVLEQAKKRYPKKRVVLAHVPKEETLVLVSVNEIWRNFQTSCRI